MVQLVELSDQFPTTNEWFSQLSHVTNLSKKVACKYLHTLQYEKFIVQLKETCNSCESTS